MKNYDGFISYLKGMKYNANYYADQDNINRVFRILSDLETFLLDHHGLKDPDAATAEQLADYYGSIGQRPVSLNYAKTEPGAVRFYYEYLGRHDLVGFFQKQLAEELYSRKRLSTLVGVDKQTVKILGKAGYSLMGKLLEAGRTKEQRLALSSKLGLSYDALYRIIMCCDMARLTGLSGKMLYYCYEAGYQSLRDIQMADTDQLVQVVKDFMVVSGKRPSLPQCSDLSNLVSSACQLTSETELD